MNKLLDGKVALVTGGGRGIGRGIALAMAQAGASVVVNDLGASLDGHQGGEQPAHEAVAQIEVSGGRAITDGGSVADWNAAHRMVETALDNFGRIDIVVNNAGNLRDAIFHRMTEEEFDAVISVHLKGSFNVAHLSNPDMDAALELGLQQARRRLSAGDDQRVELPGCLSDRLNRSLR